MTLCLYTLRAIWYSDGNKYTGRWENNKRVGKIENDKREKKEKLAYQENLRLQQKAEEEKNIRTQNRLLAKLPFVKSKKMEKTIVQQVPRYFFRPVGASQLN